MANPILVTGAAGRVGAVGRTVTELLLKRGNAVRAMAQYSGGGQISRCEGVHQYVADDGRTDEYYRNHPEPAAQAAMALRAGAELVRSAGRARAADSVSRRLLPALHFGFGQEIKSDPLSSHRDSKRLL